MRAQLCSVFVAAAAHLATASTASVSTDFQLTARFFPGAGWADGGPEPWRLTISSDGKALQETYSYRGDRELKHIKATQLSQSALTDIVTAFRRIHFFTLPKKMIVDTSGEPGHQMGITLKLTSDGNSHTLLSLYPELSEIALLPDGFGRRGALSRKKSTRQTRTRSLTIGFITIRCEGI